MRGPVRRALRAAAAVGLAGVLSAAALAPAAQAQAHAQAPQDTTRFLVRTSGAVPSRAHLAAAVHGVLAVRPLAPHLAVVAMSGDPARARSALAAAPAVAAVSSDVRTRLAGVTPPVTVDDTYFRSQWDLWDRASSKRAGGYGIDVPRAWTKTKGDPSVVVAVLDTGITAHPDLAGASILPGYDFVSGTDGVGTGDGDGWDPDPSDPGDACSDPKQSSSWHGTFVTSELVAQANGVGVVGAAPGVSVLPVRVLGACGGVASDAIAAIEWASGGQVPGVPVNPHPAQVISMSLATESGACSPALQAAVDDAAARGAIVVAAAGNESHAVSIDSPANCAGVVSVAATTRSGGLAAYSNRGDRRLSPTIAAPGGTEKDPVFGDTWTSTGAFDAAGNVPAISAEVGTSMATPRVAAAIALLLSAHPGIGRAEVLARLVGTATRFPSASSCTVQRCGAGIVNAGSMVRASHLFVRASAVRVRGAAVAAATVRADAGTWHPAYQRVRYRWLRDGEPIVGAVHRTFRLRSRDVGHRISVTVTVSRAGTVSATATSAAVLVRR